MNYSRRTGAKALMYDGDNWEIIMKMAIEHSKPSTKANVQPALGVTFVGNKVSLSIGTYTLKKTEWIIIESGNIMWSPNKEFKKLFKIEADTPAKAKRKYPKEN